MPPKKATTTTVKTTTTKTTTSTTKPSSKTGTQKPTSQTTKKKDAPKTKDNQKEETKEELIQKEQPKVPATEIVVKYSHYNKKFPLNPDYTINFMVIDEEYCLSDVFLGNFKPHLLDDLKNKVNEKDSQSYKEVKFTGLKNDGVYVLIIDEDQVEEANREYVGYKSEQTESGLTGKRQEGCSCLFGNPCMESEFCKDWNNRFDVSKKNGWKGHN